MIPKDLHEKFNSIKGLGYVFYSPVPCSTGTLIAIDYTRGMIKLKLPDGTFTKYIPYGMIEDGSAIPDLWDVAFMVGNVGIYMDRGPKSLSQHFTSFMRLLLENAESPDPLVKAIHDFFVEPSDDKLEATGPLTVKLKPLMKCPPDMGDPLHLDLSSILGSTSDDDDDEREEWLDTFFGSGYDDSKRYELEERFDAGLNLLEPAIKAMMQIRMVEIIERKFGRHASLTDTAELGFELRIDVDESWYGAYSSLKTKTVSELFEMHRNQLQKA